MKVAFAMENKIKESYSNKKKHGVCQQRPDYLLCSNSYCLYCGLVVA